MALQDKILNFLNKGRQQVKDIDFGNILGGVARSGILGPGVQAISNPKAIAQGGRLLQKFPDTTIKTPSAKPIGIGPPSLINLSEVATSIPGELIRSYGRSSERLATPQGRQRIKTGVQKLKREPISLNTLTNPAVETALDLTDFIPIGGLAAGAVKGLFDARKMKKLLPKLKSVESIIDNFDSFSTPELQMGGLKRIDDVLGEIDEGLLLRKNKQLRNMQSLRPQEYRNYARRLVRDAQYSASRPGVKVGHTAQSLKELGPDEVLAKGRKKIGRAEVKKPLKVHLDEFYTNWVNRFHPIEKLTKGLDLKAAEDPAVAVKRLLGAGGKAQIRFNNQLDPILKLVDDIPSEDVDLFLKAKRDLELAGRGLKGSNKQEAEGILAALSGKYDIDKLDNFAQQLYGFQRENLDMLKDAGFLSEDAVEAITSANRSYVPFRRVIDELDEFLGLPSNVAQQPGTPIKKIKGSERGIESPLEGVMINTFKTEAAVSKNRVASLISKLPDVNPEYKGIIRPITETKLTPHITVWENGQKRYYQVPKEIEKAVKGLNEEQAGLMVDILSAPARILRQGATGRNLEFMLPNVFRDQFDAAINAKDGYIPFVDYLIGLQHVLKNKFGGGDKLVEQWINSGGKIFFESMSGRKTLGKQLKDVKPRVSRRLMNWALGGIDIIGELSETPTRVGVFRRSLKKTGDPLRAAVESREATLDFARMGAKMKVANSLIPFLNVGIQGFDRMVRTAKNNPKRMAMVLTAYAGVPQLVLSLYNNLNHGEAYAQVPDFEKEGNFIIMTGGVDKEGTPTYFKIPKGHITELVANPTDNFVTWLYGSNPQTFGQLATAMISSSLPLLGQGNEPGEVARRTLGNVTPQALKPGLQTASNYDLFRGRQIVPEYMTKKPPEEQVFKSTEAPYKKAGDVLGVSPLKVKNFAETSLAGFAKQPVNLIETLSGRGNVNKTPITRRFIGSYEGFDTERPEKKEGEGILSRLLKPTEEVSAAEELLPTRMADVEVLYKDAQSTIKKYAKKSAKLRVDGEEDKLPELQEELVEARNIVKQIEQERPGEIYKLDLRKMKTSRVADRAQWVVDVLKETPEAEKEAKIAELWEEKIITPKSNGVAQYIEDNYDLDVWKGAGVGKGKKGTIKVDFRKFVKASSYSPRTKAPKLHVVKPPRLKLKPMPAFKYKGKEFSLKD